MCLDVFSLLQTPNTRCTHQFSASSVFRFCSLELVGLWSFEVLY